jgi:hypothetical protein
MGVDYENRIFKKARITVDSSFEDIASSHTRRGGRCCTR